MLTVVTNTINVGMLTCSENSSLWICIPVLQCFTLLNVTYVDDLRTIQWQAEPVAELILLWYQAR